MKATREEMFQEAVKRMQMLRISKTAINDFKADNDEVYYSENTGVLFPTLYWVRHNDNSWEDAFNEWKTKNPNKLPYHLIHNNTEFGEILDILFVSEEMDDWDYENEDIKDGYIFVYSLNLSADFCSEYGSICYKPVYGALKRIG